MPISDFRLKKLKYVFNVFFDVNHSGNIDKKDFELAIEQISKMRGWTETNPLYQQMKDRMLTVWDGLQKSADDDADGQVSLEEWCNMWEEFARKPDGALEWQNVYMDLMFDVIDTSGDGTIDQMEFCTVCDYYGLKKDEASDAFSKFSKGGTVQVTRSVYQNYWREYFASDDQAAPGNFIFGKTTFT